VSGELSHHLVGTSHAVVISDEVLLVIDSLTMSIGLLAFLGRSAITADVVGSAHAVLQVERGVLLA